jgi:glycosyltransferase involved in cell wall biosynthesis
LIAAEPTVSVCIRAFDRPAGLREAIASVLAQSFSDLEVVISDDSGGLEPVVCEFDDPRVRYHRNESAAGPVANIRTAFGLARGSLLALLDDDDRLLPGFLKEVVHRFDSDPELGVVFTDCYLEAGRRRAPRRPRLTPGRHDTLLREILEYCPMVPSATVMRRAVWEDGERELPLVDTGLGDHTMRIRAALGGWPFYYVDEPLVAYRVHEGQMTWTDEALWARSIATYGRFRFDDPVSERLRHTRLAEAHLARAEIHLRRGRFREARIDFARAWSIPASFGGRLSLVGAGLRRIASRRLSHRPAFFLAAAAAWRRLRRPASGT